MRHLFILALILILIAAWTGTSHAQTKSASDCEVCLRRVDFEQCEADALAVDERGRQLHMCQRELDAERGGVHELRVQLVQRDSTISGLERALAVERARISRSTVVGVTAIVLCGVAGAYGAVRKDWWLAGVSVGCASVGAVVVWK